MDWLHDKGFAAGSICSRYIMYKQDEQPYALLHTPGITELGTERNPFYAKYPYYAPDRTKLEKSDDVTALAVLIIECLYADHGRRSSWIHEVSPHLAEKYDYSPSQFIQGVVY